MAKPVKPSTEELVACEICLKEIPVSEAKSEEALDYVVHFCGLECYAQWKAQNDRRKAPEPPAGN
ncbi:MAG: DUF3330 domain-containing protein [Burkholderiales bacterium]